MARIGAPQAVPRVRLLHHCASVPPGRVTSGDGTQTDPGRHIDAGRRIPGRASAASGPGAWHWRVSRGSGRTYASFAGVQSSNYWSSSTNADNPNNAWNVNLNNGNVNNDNKTNDNYVWPVRAGEWWPHRPAAWAQGRQHV